jgi:tRNA-dihydrouridine synthase B
MLGSAVMHEIIVNDKLPWAQGSVPLMLAPMQGLTNRALRGLFIDRVRPDVVFTEFVRVKASARKNIAVNDRHEAASAEGGVPLVVQLIGNHTEALLTAANTVQALGAKHLNINLGCPFGRMTGNTAGGALLREPVALSRMLDLLRREIKGGFSVKVRSGFADPEEIFSLLGLFADCGIDFLIIHPRTVKQRYTGDANHTITAEVVRQSTFPVIANGDIFSEATGRRVLAETGAAGLMLGRGAIADPLLFERLRGRYPRSSDPAGKVEELREYLLELSGRYHALFCGEQQVLSKLKKVLCYAHAPEVYPLVHQLKRCKSLSCFRELLDPLSAGSVDC